MSTPTQRLSPEAADDRAEILFFAALKHPRETRSDFLNEECGTDHQLRAEVDALLLDHEKAGSFLNVDAPISQELEAEFLRLKPEETGDRIGPYRLMEQVGEGGFGRVWVAEQERPIRRRVALKIIKLGMDTKDVVSRFEQERQALALMDHPNIAKVLDAGGTPTGRPFFVMELVRGVKVTDYCDQAQLSTPDRLKLFIAVCHAVQHAHQKGVIHRDLKPGNVLVALHDGVPVPKVIDFGVAKATQQQRLTDLTVYTHFEQMIGTPLYMSPEQAEFSGLDIDTRSDIYSLGVLLYELLTGRTPFDATRLMNAGLDEMRRVIREEEPQKPSTLLSTMAVDVRTDLAKQRHSEAAKLIKMIKGDLDWIVMKALEKDRNRRYETANELARDIERHLSAEPVQARPPSTAYRIARMVRRNKTAFAAVAGIALALLVGSAASVWQALRAQRGENKAKLEADRANAALVELRATAPAFAAAAAALLSSEQFDEAIEKLNVAIKLRPDAAEYYLSKANILESQLRFSDAAANYFEALRVQPGNARAERNLALCEGLAARLVIEPNITREGLAQLLDVMSSENRSPAEMMLASKLLGKERKIILDYWMARLKDLPISPERPVQDRITLNKEGELVLDLSSTDVADLTSLIGMPLRELSLGGCHKVDDLRAIVRLPLRNLVLSGTEVIDLTPLSAVHTLTSLAIDLTKVRDLSPLRELPLKSLILEGTLVSDLSPLSEMPLETLNLRNSLVTSIAPLRGLGLKRLNLARTAVADLEPLRAMPLNELDCTGIAAIDFSPISALPVEALSLQSTSVKDLSFLRGMPLKVLLLTGCRDARGWRVLQEIQTLEVLTLPGLETLPTDDYTALAALRMHPALQQIQFGSPPQVRFPVTVTPQAKFWPEFEEVFAARSAVNSAEALARAGNFKDAAQVLRKNAISMESFQNWVALGALLFASGDLPAYRGICKEMLDTFRNRGEGAEHTVRLCLLSPDSGISLTALRELMPHMALISETTPYRCFFLLTNGLLEYRAGRPAEAAALLNEISTDRFPAVPAASNAVLAMIYQDEGSSGAARAVLDEAHRAISTVWPVGVSAPNRWGDWLVASLLAEEAESRMAAARNTSAEK